MNAPGTNRSRDELDQWNVVVTVRPGAYVDVRRLLHDVGQVGDTRFDDVLLVHVENPMNALKTLQLWCRINPAIRGKIERIVPVSRTFDFDSCEEFEDRATDTLRQWLPSLSGKCLSIRGNRYRAVPATPAANDPGPDAPQADAGTGARGIDESGASGWRGDRPTDAAGRETAASSAADSPANDSADDEDGRCAHAMGAVLQRVLRNAGMSEPDDCTDADLVLDVECVGNWAGLSLWTRGELKRYPEIGIDPWEDAAPQSA